MLCRVHLLGEHRELHALWSILVNDKKGYRAHPETKRWEGRLAALYIRHERLVEEMQSRGYTHHSPLDKKYATGKSVQNSYVNRPDEQIALLTEKPCECIYSKTGKK